MKSISIFISLDNISNTIRMSDTSKANPGMGATQYLFLRLAYMLRDSGYDVKLFVDKDIDIEGINKYVVKSIFEAITLHIRFGCDYLILRGTDDNKVHQYIEENKIKVIFWTHNRIWKRLADAISRNNNVICNVCVSENQILSIIDHPAILKSTVIYNPNLSEIYKSECAENNVVFMGTLDKNRGLHVLADAWNIVHKELPGAHLYVIGGNLYNDKDRESSKYYFTDPKYEKNVLKRFGDSLSSVEFLGVLGREKEIYFRNSKLAVLNPYGYEALPVTGIEYMACSLPIISINKNGQKEIVINSENGYLCKNSSDIANKIILLLKNEELRKQLSDGSNKICRNVFDPSLFIKSWDDVLNGKIRLYTVPDDYRMVFNTTDRISILIHNIKKIIPILPSAFDIANFVRNSRNFLNVFGSGFKRTLKGGNA